MSSQVDILKNGAIVFLIKKKRDYRFEYRARSIFGNMVQSSLCPCRTANIDLNKEPGQYSGKWFYRHSDHVEARIPILNIDLNIEPGRYLGKCFHCRSANIYLNIDLYIEPDRCSGNGDFLIVFV